MDPRRDGETTPRRVHVTEVLLEPLDDDRRLSSIGGRVAHSTSGTDDGEPPERNLI